MYKEKPLFLYDRLTPGAELESAAKEVLRLSNERANHGFPIPEADPFSSRYDDSQNTRQFDGLKPVGTFTADFSHPESQLALGREDIPKSDPFIA